MTNPSGSFIWYELMATNADDAAAFYGAVVGWTIAAHSDPAAGDMDYRMIVRRDGGNAGGLFALPAAMTEAGARPCWLGYLYVADVDAAVSAIVADGGAIKMPATDLPVGRIAMVTDPQGAPFYVMTPAGAEGMASDAFSDKPHHIRWNELSTSDPDAAIAFYRKHFGWEQEGDMDMGPMGKYRFLQHGGTGIGAVMAKSPEMPVSMWSYYIGVDDIDRATAEITVQGGKILFGPMEIPGGEFSLIGMDRQGAVFGLVGPRAG